MRSMGGILARAHDASLKSQQGKPRRQHRGRAQRDEARSMSAKTSMQPRRVPCDWILCGGKRRPCFSQKKRLNIFFMGTHGRIFGKECGRIALSYQTSLVEVAA